MESVLITETRSADARSAAISLREAGYEVISGDGVRMWDEAEARALESRITSRLCGVIHMSPERILAGCESASDAQWNAALNEGALSALITTKVFAGRMAENGGGALIFLGSIHADKPVGGGFLYSINCAATQMLCREASQDYGARGVRCFYVERGISETDKNDPSSASQIYVGTQLRYPRRRMPEAGDLNALIKFLLTDGSWPLNGASLKADGGMTMFYGHRFREEGVKYV